MKMRNNRNNRGFTMVETIVAVAIVVILMAVGFIAVQNYQRSLKQLELDKTAREIFVAAQNHLAVAESQGLLSTRDRKDSDVVGIQSTRGGETYRYFYVFPGDPKLNLTTVLHDMLPQYSIDDTVRLGGSYVIEYNLESATVTNVFYADESSLSNHVFTADDFGPLFVNGDTYLEDANKTRRLNGFEGNVNAIIGWYGGDDAKDLARVKLYAPKVEMINEERLEVKVSFSRDALSRMTRDADTGAKICVVIKGKTSGKERVVSNVTVSQFNVDPETKNEVDGVVAYRCHTYVLDDVTEQGGHFYSKWCTGEDPLIPGEDITVTVTVSSTSVLANIPERMAGPTNSLFASIEVEDGTTNRAAVIKNFRHLENLSPDISRYDLETLKTESADATHAVQKRDLAASDTDDYSWDGFKKAINKDAPNSVQVYKAGTSVASAAGTYLPVNPSYTIGTNTTHYLTSYDGQSHSIEGVTIDNSSNDTVFSDAGIFGDLTNCEVKDLELRNFNVQTSNGSAGALVGSGESLTISNVLVRNTRENDANLMISASDATNAKSAGGLVGEMKGGSINLSAAAVRVTSTSGDAGGLVGSITGSTSVTIQNSYSGGHTENGTYYEEVSGALQPIYNVQASKGNAGGLVGNAANATITNCYSTCSALGKTTAGGLVGTISAGEVNKSYATGLVDATSVVGCFVGTLDSSVTLGTGTNANSYFSLTNLYDADGTERTVSAVGSDTSNTAVSAFDATATTYNAFATGADTAYPYDTYLVSKGASTYPLKNIKALSGDTSSDLPKHVTMHFGDWPMPEVLIVNTK